MVSHLAKQLPHLQNKLQQFAELYERIEVPSRTILLREGEISRRFFFVEKGCLRAWINNNGKDLTFQFFLEGQGVSSAESFRKKIPSIFTIETIEPSVIQIIHKKDYDRIMQELNNDSAFLKEMTEIIFERQLYYVREFLSFIRDTPQQRYLNLLQQKPQVVQRVPQHYIASYLGITSVHLSRIRNKLLKENKHSGS